MASETKGSTASEPAVTPTLRMFTFADLAAAIVDLSDRAKSGPIRESWKQLLEIVRSIEGEAPSGNDDELLTGRPWVLTQLSVSGFRGVTNDTAVVVDIDPRPGITVLHGANGAGKSSIADAINTALAGRFSVESGTAGKTPLWAPVAVGRDSEAARVEVTLQAGADQLRLRYQQTTEGDPTWDCILATGGAERTVRLGTHWQTALANHNPVFAYANLERKVQLGADLRDYLNDLLALGGSFARLESEVVAKSESVKHAYQTWKSAKNAAESAVVRIDGERHLADEPDLPTVNFPAIADTIDDWVLNQGIDTEGVLGVEIVSDTLSELRSPAKALTVSTAALTDASVTALQQLQHPLKELNAIAIGYDKLDETCPVCGMAESDWRSHLAATVASLSETAELSSRATEAVKKLSDAVKTKLRPLLAIPTSARTSPEITHQLTLGARLASDFANATDAHGVVSHHVVLKTSSSLAAWLEGEDFAALVAYAVAQTNRLKQWQIARATALKPFVDTWRSTKELGEQSVRWDACGSRISDLRKKLGSQRTDAFEHLATQKVQELLSDVGLRIRRVTVQAQTARMELEDDAGRPLELGMLSAGQRNAILLAPMIASTNDSPFKFVVLDDPVHAFDEMRVDLLARTLGQLATHKRVVVFTHDERLREHLLAQPGDSNAFRVSRTPGDGSVEVSSSAHLWRDLIDDASLVLNLAGEPDWPNIAATNTVRSLCRQSVDTALRSHIVGDSVRLGSDPAKAMNELDQALTTAARVKVASQLCSCGQDGKPPVESARKLIELHLSDWNAAFHGNTPTSAVTRAELAAAKSACELLSGEQTNA